MLISDPGPTARGLGALIHVATLWLALHITASVLAHGVPFAASIQIFSVIGLVIWVFHSVGDWFCSFEGGWWPFRRLLAMAMIATLVGGIAVSAAAAFFPDFFSRP